MKGQYRRKKPGQSLPLIALMIVVIIGVIGLSVDVGNAYGQQRRMQNAANASALSAMNAVIANQTNQQVWDSVKKTLAANRIDTKSASYDFWADYVFADKQPQLVGQWLNGAETVPNANQTRPANVIRLQITIKERVDTYFARVVGRDQLAVNVNGNACVGGYGVGVYPIGVPVTPMKGYHQLYSPSAPNTPIATNSALWNQVASGNWDTPSTPNGPTMVGNIIYLPVENEGGGTPSGTHIAWMSWTGANGASDLGASLTYPGNLQAGFQEGPKADATLPSSAPNKQLELQDWVNGDTGVKNTVKAQLDKLVADQRIVILPMYQTSGKVNGKSSFYVTKMGRFKLIEYGSQGNPKYLKAMYLGNAPAGADGCAKEPPIIETYSIAGTARLNRVWRTKPPSSVTNDIIIVMDETGSMQYDWADRRPGMSGYQANDARILSARRAIKTFVQDYNLQDDPDARISFIAFSGDGGSKAQLARLLNKGTNGWITACNASQIANDCGSVTNKWKDIQQAADNLNPNGYTPGPYAFERVMDQLQTADSYRNGKQVRKVVVFATDGVFNVYGSKPGGSGFPPGGVVSCPPNINYDCTNSAEYNMVENRPVWQAQQRAAEIKQTGASIFTIALKPDCPANVQNCFNPKGLSDMSSGSGYYYQVSDSNAMNNIYQLILAKIGNDQCVPKEVTELAPGATVRLSRPDNPSVKYSTVADSEGRYVFNNLPQGNYVVTADPITRTSPEDGLQRLYPRVRNGLSLSEEGQASVTIDSKQRPNGATFESELLLSLPTDKDGVALNGCTTP